MNWKQYLAMRKEALLTISAILIVSIVSFGIFNSTILASDDWSYFVTKVVFGNLHPINLTDRRPFVLVIYYGLAYLFGLHLGYYYFFNFLILFLSALLVYVVVKRAFPEHAWIASLVALVYLVYPVDYTRTWFIMIYIRFWWLVSLGVIWLLLEFVASGKLWIYALAMVGTALPLGAYEGQFGVILFASALIAFFSIKEPVGRRFAILAGVAGIAIVFLFWRISFQTRYFDINDAYVEALQFDPAILAERYLYGLYIFFIGWIGPIVSQLKLMGFDIIPWLLFYFALCGAIIFWISLKTSAGARKESNQNTSGTKAYITIFLIGVGFWIAGYLPIITLYRPALAVFSSRVNLFAVPGGAMMIVSGVALVTTLVTNSGHIKRLVATAILLPFIISGIFVAREVNRENQIAWDTQKKIWKGVFNTVPNLREQKRIVVIIPGYDHLRPFESFPFRSGWEIEAGAQVLYNNQDIGGNYYYKDIQAAELLFTQNGFRQIPTDKTIPYKNLVFVYYEPKQDTVTLVENLEDTLSLPFATKNYAPFENIISAQPYTAEFRWLVDE